MRNLLFAVLIVTNIITKVQCKNVDKPFINLCCPEGFVYKQSEPLHRCDQDIIDTCQLYDTLEIQETLNNFQSYHSISDAHFKHNRLKCKSKTHSILYYPDNAVEDVSQSIVFGAYEYVTTVTFTQNQTRSLLNFTKSSSCLALYQSIETGKLDYGKSIIS